MRQYYASDKKKREQANRKKQEEKRLKKLNKSRNATDAVQTDATPESATISPALNPDPKA